MAGRFAQPGSKTSGNNGISSFDPTSGWPGAASQRLWLIDYDNGDNDADGSPAHPIKDIGEWSRRVARQPIQIPDMDVEVRGQDPGSYEIVVPKVYDGSGGALWIHGTPTVINEAGRTYTIESAVAWEGATYTVGTYRLIDDLGGHPDLDALGWSMGMAFVRFTGAHRTVAAIGLPTGVVGEFYGVFYDMAATTTVEPVVGQAVEVIQLPSIDYLVVDAPYGGGSVQIESMTLGGLVVSGPATIAFAGCHLGEVWNAAIYRTCNDARIYGCAVRSLQVWGALATGGSFYEDDLQVYATGFVSQDLQVIIARGGLLLGNQVYPGPGFWECTDQLAILDYMVSGIGLDVVDGVFTSRGGFVSLSQSGDAAPSYGIRILSGSRVLYANDLAALPKIQALVPSVTPWLIGNIGKTQAEVELAGSIVNPTNLAMVALIE